MVLKLRTFGTSDLRTADGDGVGITLAQPKSVALLVYLLLARPRGFIRRDTLCALFWPDADEEHARGALSQALTRIRRTVGRGVLELRGKNDIRIAPGAIWCDVLAFEEAIADGDPAAALDLYKGPFLSGFHLHGADGFEAWAETERDRLRSLAANAGRELAFEFIAEGQLPKAAQAASRALRLAPESEAAADELIRSIAAAGDRVGALGVYESWAAILDRELELEPSPNLSELAQTLRDAPDERPVGEAPESPSTIPGPVRAPHARLASAAPPAPARGESPPRRRPAVHRFTLVATAGVILLLVGWGGLLASGFLSDSAVVARGRTVSPLARGDWLLVADFDMPGADTALALAFQTLLVRDVGSAGYASVVGGLGAFSRTALEDVLARMRLPAHTPIDTELACRIAEREGAAGVLAGRILPVGTEYLLAASVLVGPSCEERIHASAVASFDELSEAVTAISRELRERLGESRASIRGSPPLPAMTSEYVDALREVSRYLSKPEFWNDPAHGDEPLLEAIRIEPDFAFAHFLLAVHYQRLGRFDRAVPHMLRAYALRDDLPRAGQLGMEALYRRYIASDLEGAAAAVETVMAEYPPAVDASMPFLADVALWEGDWQRALDVSLEHLRTGPSGLPADLSLARGWTAAWALGRSALADSLFRVRARAVARAGLELDPGTALLDRFRHRDWQGAEDLCAEHPTYEGCPYLYLARGRLAAARRGLEGQLADTRGRQPWDRAAALAGLSHIAALVGEPDGAWSLLQRADPSMPDTGVARAPLHLNRFLLCTAAIELGRATQLPGCALESEDPAGWDTDPSFTVLLRSGAWSRRLLAARSLERGDPAAALAHESEVERSNFGNTVLVDHLIRALAFDALERPDSALAEFIAVTHIERDGAFPTAAGILFPLALVYRRIGELAEEAADTATAIRYYDAFTELWMDADPALQPEIRAARSRVDRLLGRG